MLDFKNKSCYFYNNFEKIVLIQFCCGVIRTIFLLGNCSCSVLIKIN